LKNSMPAECFNNVLVAPLLAHSCSSHSHIPGPLTPGTYAPYSGTWLHDCSWYSVLTCILHCCKFSAICLKFRVFMINNTMLYYYFLLRNGFKITFLRFFKMFSLLLVLTFCNMGASFQAYA